ncbi:MAG: hypothetical protein U5L45_02125 [Saprospiraceae bacterium]|nr:hypothetical protein [Saprospiraceae bacterium]
MKILPIIAVCFTVSISAIKPSKPRTLDFEKEMTTAKFIGTVIIDSYDAQGLFQFQSIEFKDTVKSAKIDDRFDYWALDNTADWSGHSPIVKDTVLIVLDSTNKISLFAKLIGNEYRFWRPQFTVSSVLFSFKSPAKRLHDVALHNEEDDLFSCWDGCLLDKEALNLYRKPSLPAAPNNDTSLKEITASKK